MPYTIACRAQVSEHCYDGQPTSVQFEDDLPMANDNTYEAGFDDGKGSIVCDPCYVMLMPFTPSGAALNEELPKAIEHLRSNIDFLRAHRNPAELVKEANENAARVPQGPFHSSAVALAKLAQAEVDRRRERA